MRFWRLSMLVVLALGLEAVSGAMTAAFDWVKLAGAAYLIWLGVRSIRQPPRFGTSDRVAPEFWRQVVSGFIVLWGNPKALLFFGAFLPQFIHLSHPVAPQVVLLGLIWLVIVILTDSAYILLAGGARKLFVGKFSQRAGWVSGLVLIGAGLWLAIQQKP